MRVRPLALGSLAVTNALLSVAFQWVVLTRLGAARATDAYFAAGTVPTLLIAVMSGALGNVLVPLLAVESEAGRRKLGWVFVALVGGALGALALVLGLSAGWWVPWIVPGFSAEEAELAALLTRYNLAGAVLAGIAGVQWAVLYAQRRFAVAETAPVVAGLVALAALAWALPRWGVLGAAWAGLVRSALPVLLLAPLLGEPGDLAGARVQIREAWQRFRPLLGASLYTKSDALVDRALASFAPAGLLALYGLAQQLYSLGHTVLNRAVAAPALPGLAEDAAAGRWQAFGAGARRIAVTLAAATVGTGLVLAALGAPILAWGASGRLEPGDARTLWLLFLALSGVWVCGAIGQVTSGGFYAMGDTRTPTRVAVVSFTVAIVLKVLAFVRWGLWGVAGVTSAHYVANAAIIGGLLSRRIARARSG